MLLDLLDPMNRCTSVCVCDLQKRHVLEQSEQLEPRVSALDEDLEADEDDEEEEEEEEEEENVSVYVCVVGEIDVDFPSLTHSSLPSALPPLSCSLPHLADVLPVPTEIEKETEINMLDIAVTANPHTAGQSVHHQHCNTLYSTSTPGLPVFGLDFCPYFAITVSL